MKANRIIELWKDEEQQAELGEQERQVLPDHPAGALLELSPEVMSEVSGGTTPCWGYVTGSSWVCAVTASVTVCDEIRDWFNGLEGSGGPPEFPAYDQAKGCCFTAETLVSTPAGRQPIASFKVGDPVLAFDHDAGAVREGRVSQVDLHRGQFPLFNVNSGNEQVQVTAGHRFHDRDGWRSVEHFDGRTQALDAHQRPLSFELGQSRTKASQVYNLRVEGLKSYFVGHQSLLVRDH